MYQSTPDYQSINWSKMFDTAIMWLVVFNAVLLGLETVPSIHDSYGNVLLFLNVAIISIFTIEIVVKMGRQGWAFWRDGWNVFDFLIVGITILPFVGDLTILRSFRILRALRLVSGISSIRRVVDGLVRAIPGMGAVIGLLSLVFYIYSVMGTQLFALDDPERFGDLGKAAYTLFQIMTMDDWSEGIVRPIMENKPFAWIYFVTFILCTAFAVLNLFVGVIVDAMQSNLKKD